MKQRFVLIFRQGARTLTAEEQERRRKEVRAWALHHIDDGTGLEPRVLGDQSQRLSKEASSDEPADKVIALNFLEAEDFREAIGVAKTHPGLRYGVSIEVRPWSDPRLQTAAAQPRG
jgi:hypothetical protein